MSGFIATIRGKDLRAEFLAAIGTDQLRIVDALPERAYRLDMSSLTDAQIAWLLERYGLMLPAEHCTISMK